MKHTTVHYFREYRVALGVFAVLALLAIGLASSDVSATGQSIAERNIQYWISQLNQDSLTPSRREAQIRLQQSGEHAVDNLIQTLASSSPTMRRNAAEVLGYITSSRSISPLSAILMNDSDPSVRAEAVWALSASNNSVVLETLERATVLDRDVAVREAAGQAIEGLRWSMANFAHRDVRLVRDLRVAPSSQNIVYLAVEDEILRSDDGGKVWVRGGTAPSRFLAIAVSPIDPDTILASTESHALVKSMDGGRTWSMVHSDLGEGDWMPVKVTAVAFDPRDARRVYIAKATFDADQNYFSPLGVAASIDGGQTWQSVDLTNIPDPVTKLLSIGDTLYGIAGGRVFSTRLNLR